MLNRILCLGFACLLSVASAVQAEESSTIYYNSSGNMDATFPFRVLKLALDKSGKSYELKSSPTGYSNNAAAVEAIANGATIDIVWASASKKFAEKLAVVPFPVDRGFIGFRLFLIDKARQPEFSKVKTLDDLNPFIALQGAGWADVDILRKVGLTVRTGPKKNLYRMTIGRRGDYFARGAYEALKEQTSEVANVPELAVEETVLLQYPSTTVFHVSKDRPQLRDDLLRGLEEAWKDGSYQELFKQDPDIKLALTKGNLQNRTLIKIENPNFPDELRSMDKKYWFDPKNTESVTQ